MSTDGTTLDWRDHRVNRKPKPCRVCAEREIEVGSA